jgi:hypothetical protein
MKRTNLSICSAVVVGLASAVVIVMPASAVAARSAAAHTSTRHVTFSDPRYRNSATVAVTGTVEAIDVDNFKNPAHGNRQYGVRADGGALIRVPESFGRKAPLGGRFTGRFALTGQLAGDLGDAGVDVQPGGTLDGRSTRGRTALDVASAQQAPVPVASATVVSAAVASPTPAAHHAYVAVINNRGSVNLSSSQIQSYARGVTDYWVRESNGAITSFPVAGFASYASSAAPGTSSGCGMINPTAVWNEAAAKFPGVNFSLAGNHLMIMLADECGHAGPAGVGTVGHSIASGGDSMMTLGDGRLQVGVHEVGHNLSLDHANVEYCPSSCHISEYLNLHSVMGMAINDFAPTALDSPYRYLLGVASPGEIQDVSVGSGGASTVITASLKPRGGISGLRGLRVTDPVSGATYFVDYRSGTERDAGTFYGSSMAKSVAMSLDSAHQSRYSTGVVVSQIYSGTSTKVMTRKSGSSYYTEFGSGDSYTNAGGSAKVSVLSTSSSGATVRVTLGRPIASSKPTIQGSARVHHTLTAVPGQWTAGATFTYRWYANGRLISGATKSTYWISRAYVDKYLTVRVRGAVAGYLAVAVTSAKTAKVR